MRYRPTEVAIGLAVDTLFHALPEETRQALSDVPEVARRLEQQAQAIRVQIEELDRLMTMAGPLKRSSAGSEGRTSLVADVRATYEAAQRRLSAVVAGWRRSGWACCGCGRVRAPPESVTEELTRAREIGEQTARLLQAAEEVRLLLDQQDRPKY